MLKEREAKIEERKKREEESKGKEAEKAKKAEEAAKREQENKERIKIPPAEYFKRQTDLFSQFDETGFPTHDKDGKEISKVNGSSWHVGSRSGRTSPRN